MNRWYARRHWIYLGLVALLLGDALVYFGWVRPDIVATRPPGDPTQVARLEQEVAARVKEVARLRRVREQAPKLRPQLDQFTAERFLPERTGFSSVAAELEEATGGTGVRLGRVSYESQAEKARPELLRVEINTSVEGGYPNLLRYLEELERSPHCYLINNLGVVGAEGGAVRVEMRLVTYFRRSVT